MVAKVIWLVPDHVSQDTVDMFENWAAEARAGKIIGGAGAVMYKTYDYAVDVAGACKTMRALTRGMIDDLHDEVGKLPFDNDRKA